ncbi:MAG: hypothetical protein LC749_18710 [Actinobacteria bacterium]|nr:hypothetical protein [Actinomycetota bacterium]
MAKREFLVAYDYGGGGLWGVMFADDKEQIRASYPELGIALERPAWMTEERLQELRDREWHDIDGAPWGILNVIIADRGRRDP